MICEDMIREDVTCKDMASEDATCEDTTIDLFYGAFMYM